MRKLRGWILIVIAVFSIIMMKENIYASDYDENKPQVGKVNILESEVYAPGYVNIELSDFNEDESGIVNIQVSLHLKGSISDYIRCEKDLTRTPLYTGQKCEIKLSIPSSMKAGIYEVSGITLKDGRGNLLGYYLDPKDNGEQENKIYLKPMVMEGEYIPVCYVDGMVKVYSTSADLDLACSNPFLVQKISEMQDGNTARIFVDGTGNTVISKDIFDAIKGTDKTINVHVADGVEWYFSGRDIVNQTKNIDCAVNISVDKGENYGGDKEVLKIDFISNGQLPGKATIKLKSDYIYNMYGLTQNLYLYYFKDNKLELTDNPEYIIDGSDHWCKFDIDHNSTYLISGKKLQENVVLTKEKIEIKKVTYKITNTDNKKLSVEYVGSKEKNAKIKIPATVKIDGKTYKVTSVGEDAFKGKDSVKEIVIGKNINKIGNNTFLNCKNLKKIEFGNSVVNIGESAFSGCKSLTEIKLPNKLKKIGKRAFSSCKNLKQVTIGAGVTLIGEEAFCNCKKLTKVFINSKKVKSVGKNAFKNISGNAKIKVPDSKLKQYKKVLNKAGQGKKVKICS